MGIRKKGVQAGEKWTYLEEWECYICPKRFVLSNLSLSEFEKIRMVEVGF